MAKIENKRNDEDVYEDIYFTSMPRRSESVLCAANGVTSKASMFDESASRKSDVKREKTRPIAISRANATLQVTTRKKSKARPTDVKRDGPTDRHGDL